MGIPAREMGGTFWKSGKPETQEDRVEAFLFSIAEDAASRTLPRFGTICNHGLFDTNVSTTEDLGCNPSLSHAKGAIN